MLTAARTWAAVALAIAVAQCGLRPTLALDAPQRLAILYLDREQDPDYREAPVYAGLSRRIARSAFPAATLAVRDNEAAARAAGFKLELEHRTLLDGETAASAVAARLSEGALGGVIVDLQREETVAVAAALSNQPLALFNARHRDDALRDETCAAGLFHTQPAWSALSDALAQALLARNWKTILLLEGGKPDDRLFAGALVDSVGKFGLKIAARRDFVSGNDPRNRRENNVRLLTAGADYDVVAVADAEGDFGRTVAYNTARPRPVVGLSGLMPSAWHPYFERFGAPQLNRRFFRLTGGMMSDADWATWVAVRSLVDAALLAGSAEPAKLVSALLDPDLKIELYKGAPGGFRRWSHELRQPILLGTLDAVVAVAPVEGALHRTNNLDTLGRDEPEFKCAAAP